MPTKGERSGCLGSVPLFIMAVISGFFLLWIAIRIIRWMWETPPF